MTSLHIQSKRAPENSFCVAYSLKPSTTQCSLLHWSGKLLEQLQYDVLPEHISVVYFWHNFCSMESKPKVGK